MTTTATIWMRNQAATILLFGLIGFGIFTQTANSDDKSEAVPGVLVEEAVVRPAKISDSTSLKFKVTNFGNEKIVLKEIRSDAAIEIDLKMVVSGHGPGVVTDVPILPEETLDLSSSHISVELSNLTRSILPGSTVEFELVFAKFSVKASAHSH